MGCNAAVHEVQRQAAKLPPGRRGGAQGAKSNAKNARSELSVLDWRRYAFDSGAIAVRVYAVRCGEDGERGGLCGNGYVTTIHAIVSAVIKLSRIWKLPHDRKVTITITITITITRG
eukprot:3167270-Rhodomonas_salina.1